MAAEATDSETELCIAVDSISIRVKDYTATKVRSVELEDIDPDSDVASVLTSLKDTWPDLLNKGHYALMHVDDRGRRTVLRNRDILSRMAIGTNGTNGNNGSGNDSELYYIDVNRINIGRDYWAPPSSARPLHYRSSKAYVQEVLGVANGFPAGKERTKLYSLYTRTSHLILQRVRAFTPTDRDWDHRKQIEYIKDCIRKVGEAKGRGWMVKPQHEALITAVADELFDENKPHRKTHSVLANMTLQNIREMVKWQYLTPTLYLLEKKEGDDDFDPADESAAAAATSSGGKSKKKKKSSGGGGDDTTPTPSSEKKKGTKKSTTATHGDNDNASDDKVKRSRKKASDDPVGDESSKSNKSKQSKDTSSSSSSTKGKIQMIHVSGEHVPALSPKSSATTSTSSAASATAATAAPKRRQPKRADDDSNPSSAPSPSPSSTTAATTAVTTKRKRASNDDDSAVATPAPATTAAPKDGKKKTPSSTSTAATTPAAPTSRVASSNDNSNSSKSKRAKSEKSDGTPGNVAAATPTAPLSSSPSPSPSAAAVAALKQQQELAAAVAAVQQQQHINNMMIQAQAIALMANNPLMNPALMNMPPLAMNPNAAAVLAAMSAIPQPQQQQSPPR